MKKIVLLLICFILFGANAECATKFTVIMNDKGCPACRFPFVLNIVQGIAREFSGSNIQFVIDSKDSTLCRNMKNEFDKNKIKIDFFTGQDAAAFYKYYLSDKSLNDTYIAMEEDSSIFMISNINSNYKEIGTIIKKFKEAKHDYSFSASQSKIPNKIGLISSAKKLFDGRICITEYKKGAYIADFDNGSINKAVIPDSILYKYLTGISRDIYEHSSYKNDGILEPVEISNCLKSDKDQIIYNTVMYYGFRIDTLHLKYSAISEQLNYQCQLNCVRLFYDLKTNTYLLDSNNNYHTTKGSSFFRYGSGKYYYNFVNSQAYIGDYKNPTVLAEVYDDKLKKIAEINSNNIKRFIKSDSIPTSVSSISFSEKANKYYFENTFLNLYLLKDSEKTEKINCSGILSWSLLTQDDKDLLYNIDGVNYGAIQKSDYITKNDWFAKLFVAKNDDKYTVYLQKYNYYGTMDRQIVVDLPDLLDGEAYLVDNENDNNIQIIYKDKEMNLRLASVTF